MRWLFMAEIDPTVGSYEVEFKNLDNPGEGIDYDLFMPVLRRVLEDLDQRMNTVRDDASEHGQNDVHVLGDETVN